MTFLFELVLGFALIVVVLILAVRFVKLAVALVWSLFLLSIIASILIDVINGAPVLRSFAWILWQLFTLFYNGVALAMSEVPKL